MPHHRLVILLLYVSTVSSQTLPSNFTGTVACTVACDDSCQDLIQAVIAVHCGESATHHWRARDYLEPRKTLPNGDVIAASTGYVAFLFDGVVTDSKTWRAQRLPAGHWKLHAASINYEFHQGPSWVSRVTLYQDPHAPTGKAIVFLWSATVGGWVRRASGSGFDQNGHKLHIDFIPMQSNKVRIDLYSQHNDAEEFGLAEVEIKSPASRHGMACADMQLSLSCWHMAIALRNSSEQGQQQESVHSIPNLCHDYESLEKHLNQNQAVRNDSLSLHSQLEAAASVDLTSSVARFVKGVCSWPPKTCDYCKFSSIPRFEQLSQREFMKLVLQGRPFIVRMPTQMQAKLHGPKAAEHIKNIYLRFGAPNKQIYHNKIGPTDYRDVYEYVRQVNSSQISWYEQTYFGWAELRESVIRMLDLELTNRPYFIPPTMWAGHLKHQRWLFLGKPGKGLDPHVDTVSDHGTWQYQLAGTKQWRLKPLPQCVAECPSHSFTISAGEVFVLDTTQWQHSTNCLPDICLPKFSYAETKADFDVFKLGSKRASCASIGGDFFAPVCPDYIPHLRNV